MYLVTIKRLMMACQGCVWWHLLNGNWKTTQYWPKIHPSKKGFNPPTQEILLFSSSIKWGKKKQHSTVTPTFQSHIAVTFAYHYTSNMHACIQHVLSLFQPSIHTLNYSHSVWQMWTRCIYTVFLLEQLLTSRLTKIASISCGLKTCFSGIM